MAFETLKNLLGSENFAKPSEIYQSAKNAGKHFPKKIPIGEWIYITPNHHIIVWPYDPIPTAIRGALRMGMFQEYEKLQTVHFWKWEYYHDRGPALQIGKKDGLFVYNDDPIMVPKNLVLCMYYLIFHTEPADYIDRCALFKNITTEGD